MKRYRNPQMLTTAVVVCGTCRALLLDNKDDKLEHARWHRINDFHHPEVTSE